MRLGGSETDLTVVHPHERLVDVESTDLQVDVTPAQAQQLAETQARVDEHGNSRTELGASCYIEKATRLCGIKKGTLNFWSKGVGARKIKFKDGFSSCEYSDVTVVITGHGKGGGFDGWLDAGSELYS